MTVPGRSAADFPASWFSSSRCLDLPSLLSGHWRFHWARHRSYVWCLTPSSVVLSSFLSSSTLLSRRFAPVKRSPRRPPNPVCHFMENSFRQSGSALCYFLLGTCACLMISSSLGIAARMSGGSPPTSGIFASAVWVDFAVLIILRLNLHSALSPSIHAFFLQELGFAQQL